MPDFTGIPGIWSFRCQPGVFSILPVLLHSCPCKIGKNVGKLLLCTNGGRLALLRIVGHHIGQLEDERVLAHGLLIAGHLERRLYHAPDGGDGACSHDIPYAAS